MKFSYALIAATMVAIANAAPVSVNGPAGTLDGKRVPSIHVYILS